MEHIAEYQEDYARVVVSRDGDDLVFWSDFDDNGKSIVTSRARSRLRGRKPAAGGAQATDCHRQLAAEGGVLAVTAALDA